MGAIAHNVVVHYSLDDGDVLAIASKSKTYFEQVIDTRVNRVEVELLSDDSTSEKYFCSCVQPGRPFYWVPNQGLPPITAGP